MERHAPSEGSWPYELGASGHLQREVVDERTHDANTQMHLHITLFDVTSDYVEFETLVMHELGMCQYAEET